MLNLFKRFLGPPNSSDSSKSGTSQSIKTNGSALSSSNRRKSFPVVEIVVPRKRQASLSGTPSSSRARSPASDRSITPQLQQPSKKHENINGTSGATVARQAAPRQRTPSPPPSPELPASPPKRTRFNEEIQYQNHQPYKLGRRSLPQASPAQTANSHINQRLPSPRSSLAIRNEVSSDPKPSPLKNAGGGVSSDFSKSKLLPGFSRASPVKASSASTTASISNGPTRPTKRKRDPNEEDQQDTSIELEVAPSKATRKPAKRPLYGPIANGPETARPTDVVKANGNSRLVASTSKSVGVIARPSYAVDAQEKPKATDFKKTNGHIRPIASTSKAKAVKPDVIDLDDSASDDNDDAAMGRRSPSLELPEFLPIISPKKLAAQAKVDLKGKGRAIEPAPVIAEEKVLRVPVEAKFRSLDELADFPPDVRPAYALWVLARCAILGSGIDRITLDGIISRISDRYLYYKYLAYESGSDERLKLATALKTAIKSKLCFVITKEKAGAEWYSVLEDVNPALKRGPQKPKNDAVDLAPVQPNGATSKAGEKTGPTTQTSKSTALPILAPAPAPRPPPRPKVPTITTISPGDLPRAEHDIFATTLLHLKNAVPEDEPPEAGSAKDKAAPPKTTLVAMLSKRIQHEMHVPIRAAILGSPYRKLRMNALLEDLVWKYPQLAPKDDLDALKKLQKVVYQAITSRQCFFRVHRYTNKNASYWMVDRSIDPRERKKKFKFTRKALILPTSNGSSNALIAPGLGLALGVPPSTLAAASSAASAPQGAPGFSMGEVGLELDNFKQDLDELHAFYQERAEKWNRRMAYLHESEVVVVTTEPDDATSDTQDESVDMSNKEPSPELEEFIPVRKAAASPKPSGANKPVQPIQARKPAHPLAKEVLEEPVAEPEQERSPSLSPPPPPATYVCGHSDTRTGIICETRLSSREERETHQRFVHGVKASSSQQARFLAEAQQKLKKQMEQERVNKKITGQTRKKKVPTSGRALVGSKTGVKIGSAGSSLPLYARENAARKANGGRGAIKSTSRA